MSLIYILLLLLLNLCSLQAQSIWNCYGTFYACSFNIPDRPLLYSNSTLLVPSDLPSTDRNSKANSTTMSFDRLLSFIAVNQTQKYGILVLEPGNNSIVQWILSSENETTTVPMYSSEPPQVQTSFTRNILLYYFGAEKYNGNPNQVIVLSPGSSISFQVIDNPPNASVGCRYGAIIFAVFSWTDQMNKLFQERISFIPVNNCSICSKLSLASTFVRMCPIFNDQNLPYNEGRTKSDIVISTSINIVGIEPVLWNSDIDNQTFTVFLNTTSKAETIAVEQCDLLLGKEQLHLSIIGTAEKGIKTELNQSAKQGEYFVQCRFNKQEVTSSTSVTGVSFKTLVEIKPTPSNTFHCNDKEKNIMVSFNHKLPSLFATSEVYCLIKNEKYPVKLVNDQSMICNLSNATSAGSFAVLAIRSDILVNSTREHQKPSTIIIECPSTSTTSTVSHDPLEYTVSSVQPISVEFSADLLGLKITSIDEKMFPVGLINCKEIIAEYATLGEQSTCVGDGAHLSVFFGNNPTLTADTSITIANTKNPIKNTTKVEPDFTVVFPSKVISCMKNVIVEVKQITGNGKKNLTFHWEIIYDSPELSKLVAANRERILSFPSHMLTKPISVIVTGCNFIGKCKRSRNCHLQPINDIAFLEVLLSGVSESTPPSIPIRLRATPQFTRCNATETIVPDEVQFEWSINDNIVSRTDNYRIPAYTYSVNDSIDITIEITYKDINTKKLYTASTMKNVMVVAEPLVIILDAYTRLISVDSPLIIDASQSRDPNYYNQTVHHFWTCVNITTGKTCSVANGINWEVAVLQIPALMLTQGMRFNFTDKITFNTLVNTCWSEVIVAPPRLPQITLKVNKDNKYNTMDYIRIQALVRNIGWLNTSWEVLHTRDSGFFNISHFLQKPTTRFEKIDMIDSSEAVISLTIPPVEKQLFPDWAGLLPGNIYNIRLTATNKEGSSHSDLAIVTNAPPQLGVIEVAPQSGLVGISTLIEFSAGDGWKDDDSPVVYRFGLKTLLINNKSNIYWFPLTGSSSYQVYLPSANTESAGCNQRVGYTALLEVCDRLESCTQTESASFTVEKPKNLTIAIADLSISLNSDYGKGNIFSALNKIYAMYMEQCNTIQDVTIADKVTSELLRSLGMNSDINDYREVLDAASRLITVVSDFVLEEFITVLNRYRNLRGYLKPSTRKKRAVAQVYPVSEDEAMEMLQPADLLLEKDQRIVEMYLSNIRRFSAGFCIQLDASSTRLMSAEGEKFTYIQAQSLTPGAENFLNTSFSFAGETRKIISFSPSFRSTFSSWRCGSSFVCQHVCHASARIAYEALDANKQLKEYFFGSQYGVITRDKIASHLYQVSIIDPYSGDYVPLHDTSIAYMISIPLQQYHPSQYYACLLFVEGKWDATKCIANEFANKVEGVDSLLCSCSSAGIISVFTTNPPDPSPIPDHNEIQFTFSLSSTILLTNTQQSQFVINLSTLSNVDYKRFVMVSSEMKTYANNEYAQVNLILRPPFRLAHLANNYAVQAILHTVNSNSGFKAFDFVIVNKTTYTVINRTLVGDTNARKIIMKIDHSYQTVVGNNSEVVATQWSKAIADTLRVNPSRIKNAKIFIGIVFNFTVTRPFKEEDYPLSAEEISLMIMECSKYSEFDLRYQNEAFPVENITEHDIIELRVAQESNTLVLVLVIVISTILISASMYVGGAVVVKLRTDRLIEQERHKAIMVDSLPEPLQPHNYVNALPRLNNGRSNQHGKTIRSRHY